MPTRIISVTFSALFFLVPLILTPWNYELFEFNKMLLVYIATVIITAAWAIRMIMTRHWRVKRTPFDIPLLLFLTSQILSTIFSIDPHTSIFGYYSRFHGSLLSTIAYILLYYAFVSNLNFNHVLRAIRYLLISAALVAFYAIAQHFGIDKHLWVQDVQTRVFSTLGQPNWLAAFILTLLPLTIALSITSKSTIYHLLFTIYYLTLLYTKSRSGLLGFAVAYLTFWFLVFIKDSPFPKRRVLFRFFLVSCILLFITFFDGLRWLPRYELPATSQIGTQLESGGSESGDIRRIVWKGALKIWRHYPLFGSGVETFAYSYYNFRSPEHNLVSEWDFLYNKAHNEYLNFLATTGIVGLGAYLLLQAWIFIWLFKNSLNTKYYLLNTAFLSGLAGLSISNFFGFSTVPVALLFFLYPAFAIVLIDHET